LDFSEVRGVSWLGGLLQWWLVMVRWWW